MKKLLIALVLTAVAGVSPAHASAISGIANVDDLVTIYLSTDEDTTGTPLASSGYWGTAATFSNHPLTSGVTHYLQVVGRNTGGPAGFLGAFELTGGGFTFANGSTRLLTGDGAWGYSTSGFGDPTSTPTVLGANGVGPWGLLAGYGNTSPSWVWGTDDELQSFYFSAVILPTRDDSVPEPTTVVLLGTAAAGLLWRRRRD